MWSGINYVISANHMTLDMHTNVAGLNRLIGSPTAMHIWTNDQQTCTHSRPLKTTTNYQQTCAHSHPLKTTTNDQQTCAHLRLLKTTTKYQYINVDSKITGSMDVRCLLTIN